MRQHIRYNRIVMALFALVLCLGIVAIAGSVTYAHGEPSGDTPDAVGGYTVTFYHDHAYEYDALYGDGAFYTAYASRYPDTLTAADFYAAYTVQGGETLATLDADLPSTDDFIATESVTSPSAALSYTFAGWTVIYADGTVEENLTTDALRLIAPTDNITVVSNVQANGYQETYTRTQSSDTSVDYFTRNDITVIDYFQVTDSGSTGLYSAPADSTQYGTVIEWSLATSSSADFAGYNSRVSFSCLQAGTAYLTLSSDKGIETFCIVVQLPTVATDPDPETETAVDPDPDPETAVDPEPETEAEPTPTPTPTPTPAATESPSASVTAVVSVTTVTQPTVVPVSVVATAESPSPSPSPTPTAVPVAATDTQEIAPSDIPLDALEDAELVEIEAMQVPLVATASTTGWSIANLTLAVFSLAIGLMLSMGYLFDLRHGQATATGALQMLTLLPAVAACSCFFATSDMSSGMGFADKWTLALAVMIALQVGIARKVSADQKKRDEEEYYL